MQLPPVRQIAADLGVNLNTIAVAYRELQTEGLIAIKPGSGATVASRVSPPGALIASPIRIRAMRRFALRAKPYALGKREAAVAISLTPRTVVNYSNPALE